MPRAERPPGWYPDPDDPVLLRYWSGRSWDHRRRVRPPWTLAITDWDLDAMPPVVEGPAHVGALAANAGPPAAARPRGHQLGSPASRWSRDWAGPPATSLGRPARLPSGPGGWARPRRPLVVLGAVLTVAVLAIASTTGLAERGPDPQVTAAFVTQANQLCQSMLAPTARPASSSASGTGEFQQTISGVRSLAQQLGSLAHQRDNTPDVNAWVGSWRQWAGDESAFETSIQASATVPSAETVRLARLATLDAQQADAFAADNGIRSCLLSPQLSASPVVVNP